MSINSPLSHICGILSKLSEKSLKSERFYSTKISLLFFQFSTHQILLFFLFFHFFEEKSHPSGDEKADNLKTCL
jgi:hypothetical protein